MDNLMIQLQQSLGNSELLILALMFSAVILLVLGGAAAFAGGNPVKRRLRAHVSRVGPSGAAVPAGRTDARTGKARPRRSESIRAADDHRTSSIKRKLTQAGYSGASAVSVFFFLRIAGSIMLPVAALFLLPILSGHAPSPTKLAVFGIGAALFGFYLPTVWVDHRIGARQAEARQGFPDALDMLLVCVEAGLSLAAALNRVGQEIGGARPLLGEHFRLVALEMQAGKSREQALRNMADRVGIDECRSLVTLLLQSEALGTSIGQSLRVHAEEMRRKRLVRAEERGNKLPAKMTIPLICFILPSLLSVVMTPLIITYIRVVAPALLGDG